jgi:hypothetical protein
MFFRWGRHHLLKSRYDLATGDGFTVAVLGSTEARTP